MKNLTPKQEEWMKYIDDMGIKIRSHKEGDESTEKILEDVVIGSYKELFLKMSEEIRREAQLHLWEYIHESLHPYPSNNNNKQKEKGYHEAVDGLFELQKKWEERVVQDDNKHEPCSGCGDAHAPEDCIIGFNDPNQNT